MTKEPEALEVIVETDMFGNPTETVIAESELAREHWDDQLWRRPVRF